MRTEHPNIGPDKTRAVNAEAREHAWQALELRKTGKTYRQIAARLQCSLGTAHGYVTSALAELRSEVLESARDLREIEIAKLDDLEVRLRRRFKPDCSDADCAKLATAILKISESRRKLLGLDAPQRVEMSGNLYTVREASPDCTTWGTTPLARSLPPT